MFSKVRTVVILAAAFAMTFAQHGHDDGHGYSSQSIVLHQISHPQEKHEIYEPSPLQQDYHYTPIGQHIAPVVHHAPIVQHVAPVEQHVAPVVQHVSPVEQHFAPVVQHVAPVEQHFAPVVQHLAPVVQHISPVVHQSLPVLQHVESHNDHHEEQHYAPAKYEFAYEVVDKHTGDIKSQHEIRDGYHVKGEYSLHQPDGRIRTVKYDADKHTGFNADVHYSGHAVHIEPQQHHH